MSKSLRNLPKAKKLKYYNRSLIECLYFIRNDFFQAFDPISFVVSPSFSNLS